VPFFVPLFAIALKLLKSYFASELLYGGDTAPKPNPLIRGPINSYALNRVTICTLEAQCVFRRFSYWRCFS
jgi:hypothetical protein